MTLSVNSDAAKAAVTVAAQRIAGYADRNLIQITPAQCEELAEQLVHLSQAFFAGLAHSTSPADTEPAD